MSDTTVLTRRRSVVLADLLPGLVVRDILVILGGAALVGALAQISIPLSFTPVPITGQTLGVLVTGCALGWKRASAALLLYVIAGFAGLPWFVHHTSGWQGPSTGYLFGFILASFTCGWLAAHQADRKVWRALPALIIGDALIYVIGVPWLAIDLHVGLAKAISLGLTPFLGVDAIKAGIGALLLPAAWKLAGERDL